MVVPLIERSCKLDLDCFSLLEGGSHEASSEPPFSNSQPRHMMLHNHALPHPRQPPNLQTSHSFSTEAPNYEHSASAAGPSYGRDTPVTRGRPLPGSAASNGPPPFDRAHSAQPHDPGFKRSGPVEGGGLQRKTSQYGHHRQTSVIHGVQHSRNPSFNSVTTASPLSPESLAGVVNGSQALGSGRRGEYGSNFSSPVSESRSNLQGTSIDSTLVNESLQSAPSTIQSHSRRPTMNSKSKKSYTHGSSQSQAQSEARTPGEYALHHLFNSFVVNADQKINQCIVSVDSMNTPVEQTCGPTIDPTFDQLITALGHIARSEPKPLVDSLMLWRKAKGDAASAAKRQLQQQKPNLNGLHMPAAMLRRNTEPLHVNGINDANTSDNGTSQAPASVADEYTSADRRATVSVYLLCRVLIEVFEQSTLEAITVDLADKLEDIVFTQLRDVDPVQIMNSSLRLANWRIYGQVLGQMSAIDFTKVTQRFVNELDMCQQEIAQNPGSTKAKDAENRAELLILGMRHVQIGTSQAAWPASCDFLRAIGALFVSAHGPRIKQAYCQVLERLLLPLAASPESGLDEPRWREFVDTTNSRLGQMLTKVRHWNSGFPLSILLVCVSPVDVFASQWLNTIHSISSKLKDRSTRGLVLQGICRLTWSYLNRMSDAPAMRLRKLEDVVKIILPQGKRTYISTEAFVAEPLIHLIRVIGFRHQDLCFRSIIFPLVNSDAFLYTRDLKIEQMEPEKIAIGIKAFLATMADLEKGDQGKPTFPLTFSAVVNAEPLPTSPLPSKSKLLAELHQPKTASEDVSSRPVNLAKLNEPSKQFYYQFCEILGKITIVCDNTFGGQATLNEKFSGPVPKTPLVEAFSFSRKEDGSATDHKQFYYDLLHVAIQALPRCFSDHIPLVHLINLLCTGSAHVQPCIAASSAQSLRSIARQGYAQAVAIAFPRFIFSYDSKYSTMSDEGMLGPGHIETTLTLYIELLQIWTDELKSKAKVTSTDAAGNVADLHMPRATPLELTKVYPHVDEIEAYGLFFLCSQSRKVRSFAVKVLRLVTEFDKALGQDEPARIIKILENESSRILDLNDDDLSVAERSRLQKDKRRNTMQNTLIEICSSEMPYDSTLWSKVFPNLIRITFDRCPNAIALCRGFITDRLLLLHKSIEEMSVLSRANIQEFRMAGRGAATPPEVLIEQWKLYLIMACVTLSGAGAQSQSQLANAAHSRKTSKNPSTNSEQLSSARSLFSAVIPLLGAAPDSIRGAVVIALGSINRKLYRTLLESLQYAVIRCSDEAKARIAAHQRTPSSPQKTQQTGRLRTEVTHVYKLTSSFLRDPDICQDDWVLNNLITYARDLRIFLSDAEVQHEFEFQRLRIHYCGLMEEIFEGINRTKSPSRWMPFESRKSAFTLMEDWCGYSSEASQLAHREDAIKQNLIAQNQEVVERSNINAAMEIEKKNLRLAALTSMATLCAGPISIRTESGTVLSFQLPRILSWIDSIFATATDRMQIIGRRALKLLIVHNRDQPMILDHAVDCCYRTERPSALESYFDVVAQVLLEHDDHPVQYWRILAAVIFTLGNQNREIRMKSARLLRTLDERQQKSSKLQDFDISISDKTTAVYKLAQFEYSKRLSKAHPELAFTIFSEFSLHFKNVNTDGQRNMVAAILPWVQTLELQLDPNGGPTAVCYMLLANMFEITIGSSSVLHNEVQALWQALAAGPHAGNVQLILDFIISLSLERREQNFVEYAKQIVVYLSGTLAGSRVIEFFLLQLTPKNMVNEKKAAEHVVPDVRALPYVADLGAVLPMGHKQAGLSLGQVALIFLVDLLVAPVTLTKANAIKLVHVVTILWDHYIPSVQEQAREMLVHLIHELVTSKISDEDLSPRKQQIEQLVESIRINENKIVWSYEDNNGKDYEESGSRVPAAMATLAKTVKELFTLSYDQFSDLWAKEALQWASTCPVRHLACRSFQVFRCISASVDNWMLADMLARLSNTISDEQTDYQTFSLEILTTLKVIIGALESQDVLRYPQLFWTTCACLNTIHEREFFEALGMLEVLIDRVDFGDAHVVKTLMKAKPSKWEGEFDGLQPLLYKGLKSSDCLNRTLSIMHQFAALPDNDLLGNRTRLLYSVLANLPRFLLQLDLENFEQCSLDHAARLSQVANEENCHYLSARLYDFARQDVKSSHDFLFHMLAALESSFFPDFDAQSLIFMMGFLTNQSQWFRVKTMDILCALIPKVNMKKPEITCHGPDLISPLLRLLQTDLCPQALKVMDHIMEVSGNPMERHHIRMSMASGPARAIRKEYERTQSLYGIPMSSGWSIPMPAIYSSMTRNNVHAVFYTCGDSEAIQEQVAATPEFEIQGDDSYTDSYFPPSTRTATMKSIDTTNDAHMGELVHKLDSLDDLFDEPDSAETPTGEQSQISRYMVNEFPENGTNIYDQHTAPILQKSLARTASTSSFQNGLAESRPPTSHRHYAQPSISMNPGAFTPTSMLLSTPVEDPEGPGPSLPSSSRKATLVSAMTAAPARPGLHARSITSPANQFPISQPTAVPFASTLSNAASFSSDDAGDVIYDDGMLSDGENAPFPPLSVTTSNPAKMLSGPGPSVPEFRTTPTSADSTGNPSFSFQGMRRGMRRLTGGKSDSQKEKDRIREIARARGLSSGQPSQSGSAQPHSPKVPRVPLEYLNGNMGSSPTTSP